jgi:hypothetical protein
MAQRKISELPYAQVIDSDDVIPIVQDGVTKQIEFTNLKNPLVDEVKGNLNKILSTGEEIVGQWTNGKWIYRRYLQVVSYDVEVVSPGVIDLSFTCGFSPPDTTSSWNFIHNIQLLTNFDEIYLSHDLSPYKFSRNNNRCKFTMRCLNVRSDSTSTMDSHKHTFSDFYTIDGFLFNNFIKVNGSSVEKKSDSGTPFCILIDYVKAV